MSELPRSQPEFLSQRPTGPFTRTVDELRELSGYHPDRPDLLLNYAGRLNGLLGVDSKYLRPRPVIFQTGPNIFKHTKAGELIEEPAGLIKYGQITKCALTAATGSDKQQLMACIELHDDDKDDMNFDGCYFAEIAAYDEKLSVARLDITEIQRPSIDPDSPLAPLEEQAIFDRLQDHAVAFEAWMDKHLPRDDEVSLRKLLETILENLEDAALDQRQRYVDELTAALNYLLRGDHNSLHLATVGSGVPIEAPKVKPSQGYEAAWANDLYIAIYAFDISLKGDQLQCYIYGFDYDGQALRVDAVNQADEIKLRYDDEVDA